MYTFDSATSEACRAKGYSVVPLQQEMGDESWTEWLGVAETKRALQKMRTPLDRLHSQLEMFLPWIGVYTVYLRILGHQRRGLI